MNARSWVELNTIKEVMRIRDELYGKGALPPLKQVVTGKYYRHGDHSHIRCSRCKTWLRPGERNNHIGRCNRCEDYMESRPYPQQDWRQHNQSMLKGMVLANSCDYERWS